MTLMERIEQRRRLSAVVLANLAQTEPCCMYCGGCHPECGVDWWWLRAPMREVVPKYEQPRRHSIADYGVFSHR